MEEKVINYANGKKSSFNKVKSAKKQVNISSANRGMDFEKDINSSNQHYLDNNVALIYKRTTPIKVIKVDYTRGAVIKNAVYEKQSTTDYNGVYKGKYIDFEAKSTQSKTSFSFANITAHQIIHLEAVIKHGGIAFFLIYFSSYSEVFLIEASLIIKLAKTGYKSIKYDKVKEIGCAVSQKYNPRIDYLEVVEKNYF